MIAQHRHLKRVVIIVLAVLVLALGAGVVERRLFDGRQTYFDFYLLWRGSQEVLAGRNPYTDALMLDIQQHILGHPAAPEENQYRFVYPAYLAFVLFPLPLLPFLIATSWWRVWQLVLLVLFIVSLLQALDWCAGPKTLLGLALVAISFRYTMMTFVWGQSSILILGLLAAALWLWHRGLDLWCGVGLAVATVKPQMLVLILPLWLFFAWRQRRWRVWIGFAAAMGVLVFLPWPFIGNWIGGMWSQVVPYWGYTGASALMTTLPRALPSAPLQTAAQIGGSLALLGYLAWLCWQKRETTNTGDLALVLAVAVVVTLMVVPLSWTYDIVLCLLPVFLGLQQLQPRRQHAARLLYGLLWLSPIISWSTNTLLPLAFDALGWPYSVWRADKIIMPVLSFATLLYLLHHGDGQHERVSPISPSVEDR